MCPNSDNQRRRTHRSGALLGWPYAAEFQILLNLRSQVRIQSGAPHVFAGSRQAFPSPPPPQDRCAPTQTTESAESGGVSCSSQDHTIANPWSVQMTDRWSAPHRWGCQRLGGPCGRYPGDQRTGSDHRGPQRGRHARSGDTRGRAPPLLWSQVEPPRPAPDQQGRSEVQSAPRLRPGLPKNLTHPQGKPPHRPTDRAVSSLPLPRRPPCACEKRLGPHRLPAASTPILTLACGKFRRRCVVCCCERSRKADRDPRSHHE